MSCDCQGEFFRALYQLRRCPIALADDGITQYTELYFMAKVAAHSADTAGRVDAGQIRDELQISQPAISNLLKSLEKKGFLTRETDLSDRRRIKITMTGPGHAALEAGMAAYDRFCDTVLTQFTAAELEQFIAFSDRFVAAIKE